VSLDRRQFLGGLLVVPVISAILKGCTGWESSQAAASTIGTASRGRQFGFFSDPDPTVVGEIAQTGVGGVTMGPYFLQDRPGSGDLGFQANASTATILGAMRQARARGLAVTLKPMVDPMQHPDGDWRASIDPVDSRSWFADYFERALLPYLPFANTLILYTELTTVSAQYPEEWLSLIGDVRQAGFTGPISSDSDLEPATTPWYQGLDWLGGSFYPTIDMTTDTTASRDWLAVAAQITEAHETTGLPVFMAELGAPGVTDEAQLARWLTIMGETLSPLPYWAGLSWWRWPQDGTRALPPEAERALLQASKQPIAGK
jgi:hypothetical protein